MKYASFSKRLKAWIIDQALFLPFQLIAVIKVKPIDEVQYTYVLTLIGIAEIIYFALFITKSGQTIGKRVLKIKVLKTEGTPPTILNAIARQTPLITVFILNILTTVNILTNNLLTAVLISLTVVIYYFEFIVYFINQKKKMLHDFLGNTIVADVEIEDNTDLNKIF